MKKWLNRFFKGSNTRLSGLAKICIYTLLVSIGFVYVYPILYMISSSLKSTSDLVNPMVSWIPTSLYLGNFQKAIVVLDYFPSLFKGLLVTLFPALLQMIVTSIIGYGFAMYNFRFKKFFFIMIIMTFVMPIQVYMIPRYVLFFQYNLLESPLAIILPALFGQGINSAIFILIFYQFFRMIPKSIHEAAIIDGAGPYKTFLLIHVPLAVPAFITVFLFGLVWYFNETYIASLFLGAQYPNIQFRLASFVSEFETQYASEQLIRINEGIRLAATLLTILPMLIMYFTIQRWFVEGVENTGVTGE